MRAWRADLASTAFGKIIAVYGHINGNGRFVRKRPALKKAITDKMIKIAFVRKILEVSTSVLRTNAPKTAFCP